MQLFHFTSIAHLPDIIRSGRLALCESNISVKRRMAGPPVVWLTKNGDPSADAHGLQHDPAMQALHDYWKIDKTRIRFTVEVPNAWVTRYHDWAKSQGIDRKWLSEIMQTKGAFSWYVCSRPITMEDWVEIRDVVEDRAIWLPAPRPDRHLSAKDRV